MLEETLVTKTYFATLEQIEISFSMTCRRDCMHLGGQTGEEAAANPLQPLKVPPRQCLSKGQWIASQSQVSEGTGRACKSGRQAVVHAASSLVSQDSHACEISGCIAVFPLQEDS